MLNRPIDATGSAAAKSGLASPFDLGRQPTEAMVSMQKELLDAYQQIGCAWLVRVQSEVDLWAALAAKLAATRSVPEALKAYQECVAQRMQMVAEDGRRISENCQEIVSKITRSLSNVGSS
jgi:hypothetical protein